MGLIHGLHRRNLRGDLLGGLTAAVVALPLALAFGNAALGPGGPGVGFLPRQKGRTEDREDNQKNTTKTEASGSWTALRLEQENKDSAQT